MGLKFRRGTNAQKSGSLAFGEPYVNTDLGTLQIGGLTGDITLGASGTGSAGTFSGISGSSLDITGYAKIDGNLTLGGTITIGDNSSDNVVVNADLSSSIIPNNDNSFDLGSTSFRYRAIHGTNIYGTINATNGVISGSSQLPTLATTGSNTFKGNQTIIGSGAGFAAYISTSVNDATLGLDTTANVNALYFLKNGEKNFELSYDTTNANGIFRLLPYDNNSFFEIGNPSNSGADYVFISEPTYGNVLIGPGIGNGVSSLTGSIPLTDKVQIAGNLYVNGAIRANSFTGSVAATNGVVSGSSQVIGILSSLNSYTGSNDTTNTTQNSRLDQLSTASGSAITRLTALEIETANLETFTSSINTTIKTRLNAEGVISGSSQITYASISSIPAGIVSGSSQVTLSSTTGFSAYSTSVDSRIATEKGRVDAILSAADADKDSFAEIVALINSVDTTNDTAFASFVTSSNATNTTQTSRLDQLSTASGSAITRLTALEAETANLESYTGSFAAASVTLTNKTISGASNTLSNIANASLTNSSITIAGTSTSLGGTITAEQIRTAIGTVVTGSAQLVGILSSLNTYTGSNDTTNTAQNSRLTTLESVTGSYETKGRGIVSGSSQIVGSSITTNTITIGSTAIALGGTATTIAGLTSVSSTGFTGALTGNASTATTLATARTINGTSFNGSADITIANLVSGSAQITAGSTTNFATDVKTQLNTNTVVSGSGQINVASTTGDIALGTRTSGNYVASLVAGTNITLSNNSGEGATPTIGLTNNSTTIGSTAIALGSSSTTLVGLTSVTSTAFVGALTGNASTATTLATTRAINGVNFDGSAAITITAAAGTLSGATLASGVTASSLTSVGTLTSLTVSGATATGALTVTGAITATGDITAFFTSDKRHKNNIQTIPNALEKVTKLNGVTWEWNDDVNEVTKSTPKTGLIAQEVQEVLPEVVKTRDDGFLALDYSKMMGLLVEAIKEQQTQIHSLTIEIEKLKESKGL
jgi:hypothetical protein